MASIIPDRCPTKATLGEQRLFGLLRDRLHDLLALRDGRLRLLGT